MYEKPQLQRFGSFGELTQVGGSGTGDTLTIFNPITNNPIGTVPGPGDPDQNACTTLGLGNTQVRCSL
jgi:hypothetical protein